MELWSVETQASLETALAKKLEKIKAEIVEYNSWVRVRRTLRTLTQSVAA